ncbi:LppP/LprE family lipoprotein [Streptomyces sparsogenes]|uniref:LppP/LprE family lipoprotein n=1 Tax=Streptomyces sparsogenes TaxID=67365 RepID=UPI003327E78F
MRILLSAGIALAVAAGLLTAWQVVAGRPGKLAVKVTGLPAEARFTLHVSGANGFSEELTSDKTLSVKPGDYRITAKASHAKGNVYYTADETTTWTVHSGETERAVIDYAVALSERTTVLKSPGTALIERPGTSEMVFAPGSAAARKLRKGAFIVAAESEKTPRGLVREVRGVSREKDRVVVRTKDATLQQAMPKAVLRVEGPSDPSHGTKTAIQPASYQMPSAVESPEPEPDVQSEGGIKLDTWQGTGKLEGLKCGAGMPLIKLERDRLSFGMAGSSFGWNRQDGVWSRVNLQMKQKSKLTLGSPVGTHCTYDFELGSLRVPKVTAKLIRVGFFTITPEISWRLGGEVRGAAGAKLEIENPMDYRAGARLSLLRDSSVNVTGWPPSPKGALVQAADFKAKAKLGFRVELKASPIIEFLVAEVFSETAMAFEGEIDVLKGTAKIKFFPEGTIGASLAPGDLGEEREASISFPLTKPITVWESAPGEVKGKVKKTNPDKAVACPSRPWMKKEIESVADSGTMAYLGASKCWPGWAAVTWSDEPASDFVTISVFKRNARHFYPAVHLLPVMDDPYDPDWLRDCEALRKMKPPAGLVSFVGCTARPAADQDKLDAAAALRLIESADYTPDVTADRLGALPGPLRAVKALCTGSYDGNCAAVFFFHGNRFVGQVSGPGAMAIEAQDGRTVTLARPVFKDSDPNCCPSGGTARNRVRWSGGALEAAPSLPGLEQHNEPVR